MDLSETRAGEGAAESMVMVESRGTERRKPAIDAASLFPLKLIPVAPLTRKCPNSYHDIEMSETVISTARSCHAYYHRHMVIGKRSLTQSDIRSSSNRTRTARIGTLPSGEYLSSMSTIVQRGGSPVTTQTSRKLNG
jgi:hypothetical protein